MALLAGMNALMSWLARFRRGGGAMRVKGAQSDGRAVVLTLFLLAASLLTVPGLRGCEERRLIPEVERGAPRELDLTTMDGEAWRLRDHRGQVVVLNLWATWCGPCRTETPALVRMSRELAGRGLGVVGVSLDAGVDRAERVRRFATVYGITYPLAMPDPLSQLDQGVEGLPTTLLFDREGRLAMTYVGALRVAEFRRVAELLLAER